MHERERGRGALGGPHQYRCEPGETNFHIGLFEGKLTISTISTILTISTGNDYFDYFRARDCFRLVKTISDYFAGPEDYFRLFSTISDYFFPKKNGG